MNLVCILLAIAPLSFARLDIVHTNALTYVNAFTHITSFFSGISKSYDRTCSAKAKNLLKVPDDTKQCTRCLLFKLTTQQQREDPVTVLKMSEDAITQGFEEEKVGCDWDSDKIICVFGNNSCSS